MTERYIGKVAKILGAHSIVMNRGSMHGIKIGDEYIVVGIGEKIIDPDSNADLGNLEIVKGRVKVMHLQEKMATLKSCEYLRGPDKREIKKVSTSGRSQMGLLGLFGPQETETELITPSDPMLLELEGVESGDCLIKD